MTTSSLFRGRNQLSQSSPAITTTPHKTKGEWEKLGRSSSTSSFLSLEFNREQSQFTLRNGSESVENYQNYLNFLGNLFSISEEEKSIEKENLIVEQFEMWGENVSILSDKGYHSLFGLLVKQLKLEHRSERFFEAFLRFYSFLLTTHTSFCPFFIEFFFSIFVPPRLPTDQNKYDEEQMKLYRIASKRSHSALNLTLELVPSSINLFVPSFTNAFPIHRNGAEAVEKWNAQLARFYVEQSLLTLHYAPQIVSLLLSCIVDKLLNVDALIKVDELPDDDDEAEGEECLFPVELDGDGTILGTAGFLLKRKMELRANELDGMMLSMFEWLQSQFDMKDEEKDNANFLALLESFDRKILNTRQSKFTQFILFFFLQKRPQYLQQFFGYLLNNVANVNNANFKRQTSAAYIASFLARSTFVSVELIERCLATLVDMLLQYTERLDASKVALDYNQHVLFYSVCQSVFYIVCFNHSTLLQWNSDYLEYFDLKKIVKYPLNPFKFCLPEITKEFTKICFNSGLDFTNILANNEKVIVTSRMKTGANGADSYFPFDPYLLAESSSFVTKHYRLWQSEDNSDDELDDESEPSSQIEELDDASGSFRAMSITPKRYNIPSSSFGASLSPSDFSYSPVRNKMR